MAYLWAVFPLILRNQLTVVTSVQCLGRSTDMSDIHGRHQLTVVTFVKYLGTSTDICLMYMAGFFLHQKTAFTLVKSLGKSTDICLTYMTGW